jgi:hypothetical protein
LPRSFAPALTAAPNPARDHTTFRAPPALNAAGNLRLFDAAGNLVREHRFSGTRLSISLAGLQPGLYFGELAAGTGKLVTRLLVVR